MVYAISCVLKKNMYSAVIGWTVLYMSVRCLLDEVGLVLSPPFPYLSSV